MGAIILPVFEAGAAPRCAPYRSTAVKLREFVSDSVIDARLR
jgi:hypothetical protein